MKIKGTCWVAVQDIGGFTALSEHLAKKGKAGTEILTHSLQQFFTQADKIISSNNGYIFKLAGDAFFAIFPGDLKNTRINTMARTLMNLPALRRSSLQTRFVAVKGEVEGDWFDLGFNNLDLVLKGPALYDLSIIEESTPAGSIRISESRAKNIISRVSRPMYRRRTTEYIPGHRPLYVGFLQIPHDFKILDEINSFINEQKEEIRMLKWLPSARSFKGLFIAGFPESTGREAEVVLNLFASLKERFKDTSMKSGMSSGIIYAGLLGSGTFKEFAVIGDRVNIAARLIEIAPDREIYFSGEIEKAVKGKFKVQHIGATKLKGRLEPIEICQPVGRIKNIFDTALFPHRFVGRSAVLEKMRACIKKRQSCCVVGDAGMGKSRMLYEIQSDLGRRIVAEISMAPVSPPLVFLKELLQHFPLGDFEDLKNFLHGTVKLPRETALKRLKELFSLKPDLIVIIEDLHWIDEASFLFLRELMPLPFQIIASSRPDKEVFVRGLDLHELRLAPLDRDALLVLAREVLRSEPSPALFNLILEKSGGNPFYLEQLLSDLEERELIIVTGNQAGISEDISSVPFSIHSILRSRFERLPMKSQKVIEVAACLGREFTADVLDRIVGRIETHLRCGITEGLLVQSRGVYLFQHALLRDAIVSSMLESTRRRYERSIGELFIEEHRPTYEIAHHLTAAGMISAAAYYWISAFNELYDRGLENEAARIIKMLTEGSDEQTKPLGALLSACQLTRAADYYDAEYMLNELKKNRVVRKQALFNLCALYDWSGRYTQMRKSLAELGKCSFNNVEEIDFLELKGIYYDMSGDNKKGLSCYKKTLKLSRRHKFLKPLITSLHNIGWIYIKLHDLVRARRYFNEALALVPDGDLYNEGTMLLRLGHIDNYEGNLTAARNYLLRSLKNFQKTAFSYWERLALQNLVDNSVLSDDRSQAYRYATRADEVAQNLNRPAEIVHALDLYYGEHAKFAKAIKGKEKQEYINYYLYLYSLGKADEAEEFLAKNRLRIKHPTREQLNLFYCPLQFVSLYKKFVLPYKKNLRNNR